MLDKNDVENLLKIMNRVDYKGLDEAKVATFLALKLAAFNKTPPVEKPVGDTENNPQ